MGWFTDTFKGANNTRRAVEGAVVGSAAKSEPVVAAVVRTVTAPMRWAAGAIGWGAKGVTKASLHTGGAVTGVATGFAKTKTGKWAGGAMLAAAAIVGVGYASHRMRKTHSEPGRQAAEEELDAAAAALPAGPAEGRGEAEWRNRVRPGAAQEQGFQQPSMNAVPPESVQNLR